MSLKNSKEQPLCLKMFIYMCATGANGFINSVQDVLEITNTGNFDGWDKERNLAWEVQRRVTEKVQNGLNARMLAGYAWNWTAEKNGNKNGELMMW